MKLQLIEKKQETPDVESFIFTPTEELQWKAGQYLHYVLHHEPTDDRGSDRWFTVASAPFEKRPMITTRFTSDRSSSFKQTLRALQIGEEIEISSVEGDFVVEDTNHEYVFIAGGIGITPFHAILKEADHNGTQLKVNLLYANRNQDVAYKDELEAFASRNPNLKLNYVFSPERIDENKIKELVPNIATAHFYISGPEPMVKSLASTVAGMGVPSDRIKLDDFPGYPEQ